MHKGTWKLTFKASINIILSLVFHHENESLIRVRNEPLICLYMLAMMLPQNPSRVNWKKYVTKITSISHNMDTFSKLQNLINLLQICVDQHEHEASGNITTLKFLRYGQWINDDEEFKPISSRDHFPLPLTWHKQDLNLG